MTEYRELMTLLDSNDEISLYKLENDLFDTAVVIYNEDEDSEQAYVLTDMQGAYPTSIDEISDYSWCRVEDVDW